MSNGPSFFQTRMGITFFEGTLPRAVRALERIADALEAQNAANGVRATTPKAVTTEEPK